MYRERERGRERVDLIYVFYPAGGRRRHRSVAPRGDPAAARVGANGCGAGANGFQVAEKARNGASFLVLARKRRVWTLRAARAYCQKINSSHAHTHDSRTHHSHEHRASNGATTTRAYCCRAGIVLTHGIADVRKKINRSHTHTHRQRTTPPTPTHARTRREQHPKRTPPTST